MRSLLFTISLTAFIVMVGMGVIAPLLPIFAEELGASGVWIGVIFSAYSFSRLIFLPVIGRISDFYGRRKIILLGLFLYSTVTLLYAFATTPEQLSAVRLMHGATSAMVIPVAMAAVAELSPDGREGYFIGTFNRALFLGMASGPVIGGVIADIAGLRLTFFTISVIGFVTLFLVYLTFPETSIRRKSRKRFNGSIRLWTAFLYRFLNSMGRGSILSFLPIYLGLIGYSTSIIGGLISLNLFVSALIQPASGKLSDRIGVTLPVTASTLLGALILFSIPRIQDIFSLTVMSLLLGITSAVSLPAVGAIVAVEGKQGGMGQLMGTLSASKSLGRIIGPLVSGTIFDLFGGGIDGIKVAFTVASAIAVFSAIIFWMGMRVFRHSEALRYEEHEDFG